MESRLKAERSVGEMVLNAQNFKQLFDEYIKVQRKNVTNHIESEQDELNFKWKSLWHFWNENLISLESENRRVLDAIKTSCDRTLIAKFQNELAKFRTIGKIYSANIAKEIKNDNYKSCELTVSIALEDLVNRRALSNVLGRSERVVKCSCRCSQISGGVSEKSCTLPADEQQQVGRSANTTFSPEIRAQDIKTGIYWRLLYLQSPQLYQKLMRAALNDENKALTIFRGKRYLEKMPCSLVNHLIQSARQIVRTSPTWISLDDFAEWVAGEEQSPQNRN